MSKALAEIERITKNNTVSGILWRRVQRVATDALTWAWDDEPAKGNTDD